MRENKPITNAVVNWKGSKGENIFMYTLENFDDYNLHMFLYKTGNFSNELIDDNQETNLIYAVGNGRQIFYDIIKTCSFEEIEYKNIECDSCLYVALENKQFEMATKIMESVRELDIAFIFSVVSHLDLEAIKFIWSYRINANKKIDEGLYPIVKAVERSLEIFKFMVENGTDINVGDDFQDEENEGNTPLIEAIIYDRTEIVEYLLSLPSLDINLANENAITPLMAAINVDCDLKIIMKILSFADINLNLRDINGLTALDHAIRCENQRVIQLIKIMC